MAWGEARVAGPLLHRALVELLPEEDLFRALCHSAATETREPPMGRASATLGALSAREDVST